MGKMPDFEAIGGREQVDSTIKVVGEENRTLVELLANHMILRGYEHGLEETSKLLDDLGDDLFPGLRVVK